MRLAPSVPHALNLASTLYELIRLEEAERVLRDAVVLDPQDASVHGTLGGVYIKMNDGAAALACFERIAGCLVPETAPLPSSPGVPCLAGQGVALSLLGRHDEAMAAFEELLRIDRGYFERWPEVAPHYELALRETERKRQGSS